MFRSNASYGSDRAPRVPRDVLWDPDFAPTNGPASSGGNRSAGSPLPIPIPGAHAYMDVAIDQAWRAVTEIEKSS